MTNDLLNLTWMDLRLIAHEIEKMEDDDIADELPRRCASTSGYFTELRDRIINRIDKEWDKLIPEYFTVVTYPKKAIRRVRFQLNDTQKEIVAEINGDKRRVLIDKYRQEGITTLLAAFAVIKAAIKKRDILIFVPTGEMRRHFSDKVHDFIVQYMDKTANKTFAHKIFNGAGSFGFSNGSKIDVINDTIRSRGHRADYIIIDESGFIEHPYETMDQLSLCLTEGGKLIDAKTIADKKRPRKESRKKKKDKNLEPIF